MLLYCNRPHIKNRSLVGHERVDSLLSGAWQAEGRQPRSQPRTRATGVGPLWKLPEFPKIVPAFFPFFLRRPTKKLRSENDYVGSLCPIRMSQNEVRSNLKKNGKWWEKGEKRADYNRCQWKMCSDPCGAQPLAARTYCLVVNRALLTLLSTYVLV